MKRESEAREDIGYCAERVISRMLQGNLATKSIPRFVLESATSRIQQLPCDFTLMILSIKISNSLV